MPPVSVSSVALLRGPDEVSALRARWEAVQALDAASGIAGLVEVASRVLGKPVVLYDPAGRRIATAPRAVQGMPDLSGLRSPGDPCTGTVIVPAGHATGLARRHALAPVDDPDGRRLGWVAIQERGSVLTEFDGAVAELVAARLAREIRTHRRIAALAADARSHLVRQLMRGTAVVDDLRATGEHLGIDIDAPRTPVVVLADDMASPGASPQRWETALRETLGLETLTTRGSEGTLVLIEAMPGVPGRRQAAQIRAAVHDSMGTLGGPGVAAGVGEPVTRTRLPAAYREVREVAMAARRTCGEGGVLALSDLGPLRLFLAHVDPPALQQHVHRTLGPLLHGHRDELLETLQVWFEQGRSVRATARALGVHENTVRLRLARSGDLTGLDMTDATAQLDLQLALLVRRLSSPSLRRPDSPPTTLEMESLP